MKKLLFTLLVFTFLSNYAQSTYIPDTQFEIALANLGYDDGVLNHSVPTANISSITNLYIPSEGISDLTGIEDFVSLTFLNCANNNLSSIDISNNTALTIFSCTTNNLTSLDVSNNTALTSLSIVNNQIASLDLSTNVLLESLYASNNLLTSLDLSVQSNLISLECDNNLLTSLSVKNGNNTAMPNADFSVTNNPNLLCIEVDDATYSTAYWTNVDAQSTFRNSCALTYVPDDNFEQALINLGYDTVLDDYVYTEDIKIMLNLFIVSKSIADLTGIEDFENLVNLNVEGNLITNLDVSQNLSLNSLNCTSNNLSSIDISNNTALTDFSCSYNNLTSLDVSSNTALKLLSITSNQLTSIDLSSNLLLESLYASNNLISNLDISNNVLLTQLNCANNNLSNIDISNNTALTHFSVSDNNLTSLDVTSNTALRSLSFFNNQITSIDLSTNLLLESLYASNNLLTSLDLSVQSNFISLECDNNLLTSLSVKNGNNTVISNAHFTVINNPNLYCIQVDNSTYSNNHWSNVDAQSTFRNSCALTYVPDDNFEQELINLGYDTVLDDYVYTEDINTITSLSITLKSIADLTGIEDFTALQVLDASDNLLTSVDVSQNINLTDLKLGSNQLTTLITNNNTALKYLYVNGNQISSLNLSTNTDLRYLYCNNNLLTTLDTSNNTMLTRLYCYTNNLSALDVSLNVSLEELDFKGNNISIIDINDCPSLKYLYTNNNLLTNLDISNNPLLEIIHCTNNQITDIDASTQSNLVEILCNNNLLTSLNVRNGNNLSIAHSSFNALNNPDLLCVEVDNVLFSSANWPNIDAQSSFSTNCHFNETYIPDNNFEQELINLGYDTVLDDYVLTANINTITSLNLNAKGIADLTGIEDFTALETLLCAGNSLTSIDISNNTNLLTLNCQSNNITSIDTSNNLVLDTLNCESNAITNLDFAQNTLLTTLNCSDNILTSLNVFNNINLATLNCNTNQIGALNLVTNSNLSSLDCSHNLLTGLIMTNGNNTAITNPNFDSTFNPSLTCIEVDDEIYSTTNWTNIDYHASFSNNCHYGETYVPDDNFEQELINLGYDSVLDDYVLTSNINTVGMLDVSFKSINDLTGIGDFMALTQLICNNNNITNLDLGNNFSLAYINCSFNSLSDLYISSPNLNFLSASNNQLLDLDLSGKLFLTQVELQNNLLNSLNIKNGNNTSITNFNILSNPNLFCVQVDAVAYSNTNWTNKDTHTTYNTNCGYPSIWRTSHWINGVPSLTKNAIIDDDYNTGAIGSFNAYNLAINSGKNVTVSPNSYIRINTDVNNNGNFVIEHQGSFLQLQDFATLSGTGNFTVKSKTTQLIDEDRFTYFSSPVINETLNTFAPWANTSSMWSFNATLQAWSLESATNTMSVGKGYAIRSATDIGQYPFKGNTEFNGYFNNGIVSVPMHFTAGDPLLDDDSTLIGNPYPSAVNASLLLNNNPNANAFYFWTHNSILTSSGYLADDYAIWNRSGGIASASGSAAPTGFIASCQGFFVTSLASDNFIFDNSVRVTGNNTDFRRPSNDTRDRIWLNLSNDDGLFNQILINFSPNASVYFDAKLDASRLSSNNPISFYSNGQNNERFAIQALPILNDNSVVPLGYDVDNVNIQNLSISIDHVENFNDVSVYLKDNLLNITHDLQTSNYNFNINEIGTFNNRFELIFNRNALTTQENSLLLENLIVSNKSENEIFVKTKSASVISELKAFDVLGKLVIELKPNKTNFIINTNIKPGTILFFKTKLKNGTMLNNKFVKL